MQTIRAMLQDELARARDLLPDTTPEQAALFVQMQVWSIKLMVRLRPAPDMGPAVIHETLRALFTPESLRSIGIPV